MRRSYDFHTGAVKLQTDGFNKLRNDQLTFPSWEQELPNQCIVEINSRPYQQLNISSASFELLLEQLLLTLGGFSLAYVDMTHRRLRLFRDPVGQWPLYWTQRDGVVYWSDWLEDLVTRETRLNLHYFERYIVGGGLVDLWPETPYSGIYRVPRGTALEFKDAASCPSVIRNCMSDVAPGLMDDDVTDSDVVELFRKSMNETVLDYVGAPEILSLSGGMDSTSLLFSLAQLGQLPLAAVTLTADDDSFRAECANAFRAAGEVGSKWIERSIADNLPYDVFATQGHYLGTEPCLQLGSYAWNFKLVEAAKELKARAILTGFGGDQLFEANRLFISDLLASGRLRSAWSWSWGYAAAKPYSGRTALSFLVGYGIRPLLTSQPQKTEFGQLIQTGDSRIHGQFHVPPYVADQEHASALSNELEQSMQSIRSSSRYATALARDVFTMHHSFALDRALQAEFNIATHYPYCDLRLIRFCLGLPFSAMVERRGGEIVNKRLLHLAYHAARTQRLVPAQGRFSRMIYGGIRVSRVHLIDLVAKSELVQSGLVDLQQVIQLLDSASAGMHGGRLQDIHTVLTASLWLESRRSASSSFR